MRTSTQAPAKRRDVARIYLGGLLVAMALGQGLSWDAYAYADAVRSYEVDGWVLATALFVAEIAGGLALLVGPRRYRRRGAWVALAVAVAWSLLAGQAFARGLAIPNCGCFGAYLSQSLRWWIPLEDAAFVGLGGLVLHRTRGGS